MLNLQQPDSFQKFEKLFARIPDRVKNCASPMTDASFFFILLAAGYGVIFKTLPGLKENSLALGVHTFPMFIPLVFSIAFYCYLFVSDRLSMGRIFIVIFLFLALVACFHEVMFDQVTHHKGDDSARYSFYAHNMVREATLFGGDRLLHSGASNLYMDQVGFRYYLAATILATGGEFRLGQFAGMAVWLLVFILLFNDIRKRENALLANIAVITGFLMTPYAAKNILYTYSEWLTVCVFVCAFLALRKKLFVISAFFLGLAFVLRSNLLIFSPLFLLFTFEKKNPGVLAAFLLTFLLPAFHNLWYGEVFQLVAENKGGLLIVSVNGSLLDPVGAFTHKLVHLLGYCSDLQKFTSHLISFMFVPLGIMLILFQLLSLKRRFGRFMLLVLLLGSLFGPTILYGSGSYPRFEFVNISLGLLSGLLIGSAGSGKNASLKRNL